MDIQEFGIDPIGVLVLVVFFGTYIIISSEKVDRTATALPLECVLSVSSCVLFITTMMIIVTIASSSGMFQFLAIELTRPTHANTRQLYKAFLAFVFVISVGIRYCINNADNVSTHN